MKTGVIVGSAFVLYIVGMVLTKGSNFIFIPWCILSLFFLFRVNIVAKEMQRLIKEWSKRCDIEIAAERDWIKITSNFEKTSFDDLMWQIFTFKWELDENCCIVKAKSKRRPDNGHNFNIMRG